MRVHAHACLTMSASQMGSSPWCVRSLPAMYQMVSGEAPERMKSAIRCPPWRHEVEVGRAISLNKLLIDHRRSKAGVKEEGAGL